MVSRVLEQQVRGIADEQDAIGHRVVAQSRQIDDARREIAGDPGLADSRAERKLHEEHRGDVLFVGERKGLIAHIEHSAFRMFGIGNECQGFDSLAPGSQEGPPLELPGQHELPQDLEGLGIDLQNGLFLFDHDVHKPGRGIVGHSLEIRRRSNLLLLDQDAVGGQFIEIPFIAHREEGPA